MTGGTAPDPLPDPGLRLTPRTPAGARLAVLADHIAAEAERTAAERDRGEAAAEQVWASMRRDGLLAAPVPQRWGGLGVVSVHDLAATVGRLGRADGSIGIGAAMHLSAMWFVARPAAPESGDAAGAGEAQGGRALLMRACARGRVVIGVAMSEPGTTLGRPRSVAEREPDGYRITGRKAFCTNSSLATLFLVTVLVREPGRPDSMGFALVPASTPGLQVQDTWDALGMRSSGSGDVVLDACRVGPAAVVPVGRPGRLPTELYPLACVGALLLGAVFLGVAEHAQDLAVVGLAGPASPARPPQRERAAVQALVAENEMFLAAGRALVERTATLLDEAMAAVQPPPRDRLAVLMQQVQCASATVKRGAVETVDRALTLTGGRGYLNAHPLSRLYRDVRAGPFMQPFSALDVAEYIGRVRLGLPTELDGRGGPLPVTDPSFDPAR